MEKDRLTAFSDGVIAVIITLMVLDLKIPKEATLGALKDLAPAFFIYLLSYLYIAIYWNNHHHFFQLVPRVNGAILWANLHLLFWLSLIPFATGWVGEHYRAAIPTAIYGAALLMSAIAWYAMQIVIIRVQGKHAPLARAIGRDAKGKISPLLYIGGILTAFIDPWISQALYAAVALMWLIPDRRIEALLKQEERREP